MFFHDPDRRLLIYERPVQPIREWIPEAKEVKSWVVVPQTLRHSQILRHLGLPVAPIMSDYDWPASPRVKPWDHQKLAANFHVLHPRSFNLSAMGSGKTLSLLWTGDWLMKQYPKGTCRCLIIAPLSTLRSVWESNIFEHLLGRRSAVVLTGSAEKRLDLLGQPHDFYIINPDGVGVGASTRRGLELHGFSLELTARSDIKICIVDEASAYKDVTTKRHRIARQVFGKKDYLYLLTGTPTPQAPTDAYGLGKLVNDAFGKSFRTFQLETMAQVSQFKWRPKPEGYDKARQLLSPAIRFDEDQTWPDRPPLVYHTRECALSDEQVKLMRAFKSDLQAQLKTGKTITAAHEAAARLKFLQISLGAVYDEDHKVHLVNAAPRLALLKEVLEQAPGKFFILAAFTGVLQWLEKELKGCYSTALVTGATHEKERGTVFRAFQESDKPEVILADPTVLAHGLNLQRGRTAIWYSPIDKAELFAQANKRFHRPGQKQSVNVVSLVSNPLEKEMYRRLENNTNMQGALLDAIRRGDI